jgi:hypothetical protein
MNRLFFYSMIPLLHANAVAPAGRNKSVAAVDFHE